MLNKCEKGAQSVRLRRFFAFVEEVKQDLTFSLADPFARAYYANVWRYMKRFMRCNSCGSPDRVFGFFGG